MEQAREPILKRFMRYVRRRAFKAELVTLAAGALAGRIAIGGTLSPFAISYLCAIAMAEGNVHYAIFGVLTGSLLLSGRPHFEPACASTLFYVLHLLFQKLRPRAEGHERIILLCIASAAFLPVFHSNGVEGLRQGLISAGLSVLSALVMQLAFRTLRQIKKRRVLTDMEQICISCAFGILIMSVEDVQGFGFSMPVILLLAFSMIAALARGIAGVAVSVALATALTIGGEFTLAFVGGLAACTLAGAALRKMETIGVLSGFVGCSLIVGTHLFTASHTINLMNLGVAGAAILVVPREKMLQLCAYLDAEKNRERYARRSMRRIRERTAADMRRTSSVCREVAELFKPPPLEKEPSDALMQWTAQAAFGICADCPMKIYCWQDTDAAAEAVYAMLRAHERGERLRIRKPFDPACKHMPQLAAAAWQSQNQYLVQRAMRVETAQQYAFIHRQIVGICEVIEKLSVRVEEDRWLDEALERTLFEGLEKRGFRILGADASYPDARLQIHLRLPLDELPRSQKLVAEAGAILKRGMRLIATKTDGRAATLVLEESAELSASYGTAAQAIVRGAVSGDSTGERRLENGRVLYALSDGMGMGENAKLESESAIRMLFDLYSIGLERDIALAGVNKLLLQRKTDMYATLDAVSIDLTNGSAEFIKYGAPPTFIVRGGKVHEVHAEALPAGIVPDAVPAVSTATLRKADTIVLFSDGALDALGEETREAIDEALKEDTDCRAAAQKLLCRACEHGQEDDMTVMVIKIA